jgi:hypothetical protein
MLGNTAKKFKRSARTEKKMKKDSRMELFEVVDKKELEKRFPNLRNVLIVKFGVPSFQFSVATTGYLLYVLSPSLPFVFEVESAVINQHFDDRLIADTIYYLSQLRRIRIIQSLKSKDALFTSLISKTGVFVEKGSLEIGFTHPLTNKRLKTMSFPVNFKKGQGEEIHSLIQLENLGSMDEGEIEFPENCSIVSLKLIRKGMARSFTCLVWFMEKKFKGTKVYFCAVKIDINTRVNLYFTPRANFGDSSAKYGEGSGPGMSLVLSKIEISIGFQTLFKGHLEKYEFYSAIKKSPLNQQEDNYRFNLENLQPIIQQAALEEEILEMLAPTNLEHVLNNNNLPQDQIENTQNGYLLIEPTGATFTISESQGMNPSLAATFDQIQSPQLKTRAHSKNIPQSILSSCDVMLETSKDRALCMELQSLVKDLDPTKDTVIISRLLRSILPNLKSIACGIYGNFLVQILTTKLSSPQRRQFMLSSSKELANLCLDTKGIFCVQTLVDHLEGDEEYSLFYRLVEDNLESLVRDSQAGFVLKKAIQTFPLCYTQRMLALLRPRFLDYASDKFGICVIKFIIRRFEAERQLFREVSSDFLRHTRKGRQNSHFNFGLQHLLEASNAHRWQLPELEDIILAFMANDVKAKVRSKAVVQTIKLIYNYHDQAFVELRVRPHVLKQFEAPLTTNEVDLLAVAIAHWPDWDNLQEIREKASSHYRKNYM